MWEATPSNAAWIATCILVVLTWIAYQTHARDPYKHLNQGVHEHDEVQWMNMGWWTDNESSSSETRPTFHQACESLARHLYTAAGLRPAATRADKDALAKVLDVGHGAGDSLLLLARTYEPEELVGVTLSSSEANTTRQRIETAALSCTRAHQGDAVTFLTSGLTDEDDFDYIFCLDCAYHFRPSRLEFFQAAYQHLNPDGGKLALYDMTTSWPTTQESFFRPDPALPPRTRAPTLWQRIKFSLLLRLSSSSLVDVQTYHSSLRQAGFASQDISIQDVSSHVFPGFARFLTSYGRDDDTPLGNTPAVKLALRSFGSIVQRWAKGGDDADVRAAIVVATRNG